MICGYAGECRRPGPTSRARRVFVGTLDDAVVGYGIVEVRELRDGGRIGTVTELFVEPEGA